MQVYAYPQEQLAELFKAVSDPTRVRVLATLLGAGELCVCHVEGALGLTQSRASRHLTTLRRAGLVVDRRDGAWVHYSVAKKAEPAIRSVLRVVEQGCAEEPAVAEDVARAVQLRHGAGCAGGGR
jgi:ArsR family transcriptional regulator